MKPYTKYIELNKKIKPFSLKLGKNELNHYIFFHQNPCYNYVKSLESIKKYSPSLLKYSRKVEIEYNSVIYNFNVSDIHLEIDFDLLGVNESNVFQEIYLHIKHNMISNKDFFIIVCLNFQNIKKELLHIFYSFMDDPKIKIIFLTNQLSFITDDILEAVTIHREKITEPLFGTNSVESDLEICDQMSKITKLLSFYIRTKADISSIRSAIYDALVNNINIYDLFTRLIEDIISNKYIKAEKIQDVMKKLVNIIEKFNNNYRSIFHLEYIIIYLMNLND